MAIGCGAKFSKFILFVFNILFWISGLILIVVGAVYIIRGGLVYLEDIIQPNDKSMIKLMYAIIALGCLVFIIGFCGCCGAIKESKCLLGFYIGLLLFIMIAEVGCGIYAIMKKNEVIQKIEGSIRKSIDKNYPPDHNKTYNLALKNAVDLMQQNYKCCGVTSSKDWTNSVWFNKSENKEIKIPSSCCPNKDESDIKSCFRNNEFYDVGCAIKLTNYFESKFPIIIGVLIGIALFEILVVIFAFCLCTNTGHVEHSTI